MKKLLTALAVTIIVLVGFVLLIPLAGRLPKPAVPAGEQGSGEFIPRAVAGLNHLILRGTPYTRGLKAGELTKPLLLAEEKVLVSQLEKWIPEWWKMRLAIAGLTVYFYGADQFIEPNDLLEMYGTAQSAPREFDYITDGYTRQLAYHGLHEVGQMMVDSGISLGCTVAAVPVGKNWILGRNFDFEGGRIFDEEKIVKWVYPDEGFAHVSIIWAGMVGAVTGVNEKGLYISINAAGSEGFRRVGTPSTLVAYKVLREAATVDEAVKILADATMFITDIFVVGDAGGNLVKVEKSPQKMEVIKASGPFVVANHLTGDAFKKDKVNLERMREQTTVPRESRAMMLAHRVSSGLSPQQKTNKVLEILRDKGVDERGQRLHLGNRMAIDALIATHAVIWDSSRGILFVSQGPSVSGKFLGYDLAKSFKTGKPVAAGELAADKEISPELYRGHQDAMAAVQEADRLRGRKKCQEANDKLYTIPENLRRHSRFFHVLGDVQKCLQQPERADLAWEHAYRLRPAYRAQRMDLEQKMGKTLEPL